MNHKVSLDPFRKFSRQIFQIFKKYTQYLEKGSIDEAFVDLGPYLYQKSLELFPEIHSAEYTSDDHLPAVSSISIPENLEWRGILYNSDHESAREFSDWDEVFLLLASEYVAEMRAQVLEELGFTCSAGLAKNKTLAKLGSGKNKPNNQTLVRNRDVREFLLGFEITDLWGLGGKYGKKILELFESPDTGTMAFLQGLSLGDLQSKLGNGEGQMLYNIAHGSHATEIRLRIDITTMQSVKQFTSQALAKEEDCKLWIKVFASDLAGRVFQLDEEMDVPRRPKRVVLNHGNYKNTGPKQIQEQTSVLFSKSIPLDKFIDDLYNAGCDLLSQILSNSSVTFFPCTMLSLGLGTFEQIGGSRPIESFFSPPKKPNEKDIEKSVVSKPPQFSKSSLINGLSNLDKIPQPTTTTSNEEVTSETEKNSEQKDSGETEDSDIAGKKNRKTQIDEESKTNATTEEEDEEEEDNPLFVTNTTFCDKCRKSIQSSEFNEHLDWHVAKDLQDQENKRSQSILSRPPVFNNNNKKTLPTSSGNNNSPSKKRKKNGFKDQSILSFFK